MKEIVVLSLFNGLGTARLALEDAGFKIKKFYSSEINVPANKVASHNYPDTVQLGNIENWKEWDIEQPDIILAGSPCQGFSFAGRQLNFEDPRSKLFFTFIDILNHYKPEKFLLENVPMKKQSEDVITDFTNVIPIKINGKLQSAQSRKRIYWTNIEGVTQPDDLGLVLKDIMEDGIEAKGIYDKHTREKTVASDCNEVGHARLNGHDFLKRVYSPLAKGPTLTAVCGGNQQRKVALDDTHYRDLTPIEYERLQNLPDNFTSCVSKSQRYKMIGNGWECKTVSHILSHWK